MVMDQNAEQPRNNQIPTINARRTLLIGIGSTGAKVCNQILERILWTYNSPDNIPWLRSIVLETAKVDSDKLVNKYSQFIPLNVSRDDYSNLIANPRNYEHTMGFSSWNIPELTSTTDVIEDGANNTRILGRLSLLFPSNIIKVQQSISREIARLGALQTHEVSEKFSSAVGEPTHVDLSSDTHVYVVGTLCGGTASGSFIDLGYLLQSIPGYKLSSTGIFLLPSSEEQNPLLVANAYAALVELNHFSDDRSRYKAQFACGVHGVPHVASPGERPYRYLYLVQSRGGTDIEYAKLLSSSADFIYSDLIGSTTGERDAKRVNVLQFFEQRDKWGATQKYYTFGLSSIEFPYAKIVKSCSVRLSKKGFEEFASGDVIGESQKNTLRKMCPLINRENLIVELQKYKNSTLSKTIQEVILSVCTEGIRSDNALLLIREQIEAAFKGGSRNPHQNLPNEVVPQTIDENSRGIIEQFRQDLQVAIRSMLCSAENPMGLKTILSGLDELELLLKSLKAIDRLRSDSETSASINDLIEQINECRNDFWLGLVMQKNSTIQKLVQRLTEFAASSYQQRVRSLCIPFCEKLSDEGLKIVTAARKRIQDTEHPEAGLSGEVDRLIVGFNNLYARTDVTSGTTQDGWSRTVNGTELFTPQVTVEEEYWRSLRELAISKKLSITDNKEIEKYFARIAVREYLSSSVDEILSDPVQITRFDYDQYRASVSFNDNQLMTKTVSAREIFKCLRNKTIIDRLLNRSDINTILQDANRVSERYLKWSEGHPRYYIHPNKSYGFTFYNDADPRAAEFHSCLDEVGILHETKAIKFTDQNQILILRENAAFSLGTMEQLKSEADISFWRDSYKNPPGNIHSLHSRGDIEEWISWEQKDEEARIRIRNVFLTAVALEIIEFHSAMDYRFTYPRTSPADPGFIQFNNDLDKAAFAIRRRNLEGMIKLRIDEWRKKTPDGATEVVRKIDTFIQNSANKFVESGRDLSIIDMEAYMLEFIFNDSELMRIYSTVFYPNPVILSYQFTDDNNKVGYRCPHCNCLLGYNVDSLFMFEDTDGRRLRVRKCAYCKRDI